MNNLLLIGLDKCLDVWRQLGNGNQESAVPRAFNLIERRWGRALEYIEHCGNSIQRYNYLPVINKHFADCGVVL